MDIHDLQTRFPLHLHSYFDPFLGPLSAVGICLRISMILAKLGWEFRLYIRLVRPQCLNDMKNMSFYYFNCVKKLLYYHRTHRQAPRAPLNVTKCAKIGKIAKNRFFLEYYLLLKTLLNQSKNRNSAKTFFYNVV